MVPNQKALRSLLYPCYPRNPWFQLLFLGLCQLRPLCLA